MAALQDDIEGMQSRHETAAQEEAKRAKATIARQELELRAARAQVSALKREKETAEKVRGGCLSAILLGFFLLTVEAPTLLLEATLQTFK